MTRIALLCAAVLLPLAPVSAAAPAGVPLPGTVPGWAIRDRRVSEVERDETVSFQVVLPWRDPVAARRLAYAVSDPASPEYGRHLSPAQWRARFAPAPATVTAVTSWLRGAGLEVGDVPANRLVVPARGSAAAVGRTLGVTFSRYAVEGLALRAPDAAPRVPAALAALGIGVRGLDQGAALIRTGDTGDDPPPPLPEEPPTPLDVAPPAAVQYGAPCSAYDGATVNPRLPRFRGKNAPAVACASRRRRCGRRTAWTRCCARRWTAAARPS
ncbi:MAG TPA: protease pro-enzyme activation domain-containing protein [Mycobacteriales bacterium]